MKADIRSDLYGIVRGIEHDPSDALAWCALADALAEVGETLPAQDWRDGAPGHCWARALLLRSAARLLAQSDTEMAIAQSLTFGARHADPRYRYPGLGASGIALASWTAALDWGDTGRILWRVLDRLGFELLHTADWRVDSGRNVVRWPRQRT